jgi:hypothetical protein
MSLKTIFAMAAADTAKIMPGIPLQAAPEKREKNKDRNEFSLFLKHFVL